METEKWIFHKTEASDVPQAEDIYCGPLVYWALLWVLSDMFPETVLLN